MSAIGKVLGRLSPRRKTSVQPQNTPGEPPQTQRGAVPGKTTPPPRWPEWRIELMERLWGQGFLLPGGQDFVTELAKPLNIGSKASVLVIGSGMGAPARLIAETFKTFVDGIEQDPELATASAARTTVVGGLERVKISHAKYDGEKTFGRKYDAIIGQEVLLTLEHKQQLIVAAAGDMKNSGKLALTDFSLPDDATVDDDIKEWLRLEHAPSAPISEAEYRLLCKENHMHVRVAEDMSQRYLKLALTGWTGFEKWFNDNSSRRDILAPMLEEAERWSKRIELLQNGKLRYLRMLSIKNRPGL